MIGFIKTFYPIFAGAFGGFLYYNYIGCLNGSCPITGNPYISVLYGALIGSVFVFDKLRKRKAEKTQ